MGAVDTIKRSLGIEPETLADAVSNRERATQAVLAAERAYGAQLTDATWRAVVLAREDLERAGIRVRAAEDRDAARREREESDRRAALAKELGKLVKATSESAFDAAAAPVVTRLADLQRQVIEAAAEAEALAIEHESKVRRAAAVAAELGVAFVSGPYSDAEVGIRHIRISAHVAMIRANHGDHRVTREIGDWISPGVAGYSAKTLADAAE